MLIFFCSVACGTNYFTLLVNSHMLNHFLDNFILEIKKKHANLLSYEILNLVLFFCKRWKEFLLQDGTDKVGFSYLHLNQNWDRNCDAQLTWKNFPSDNNVLFWSITVCSSNTFPIQSVFVNYTSPDGGYLKSKNLEKKSSRIRQDCFFRCICEIG